MPYSRETLTNIKNRVLLTLSREQIPHSFKSTLGTAMSGLSHMLHGHVDYLARNMLPDTSERDYLERWASIWGEARKKATPTKVKVQVKSSSPDARIPASWLIDGEEFACPANLDMSKAEDGVIELISKRTGPLDLFSESATVQVTTEGIESQARITSVIDGTSEESDDSLRRRLLQIIQAPPQGGSYLDYINWVESIDGVRQAWVKPSYLIGKNGKPGHVHVTYVESDAAQSEAVRSAVELLLAKVAPGHATVSVKRPEIRNVTIQLVIEPSTDQMRASAWQAIKGFFQNEAKPGGYLDATRTLTPSKMSKSNLDAAVSAVEGEISHTITYEQGEELYVDDGQILVPVKKEGQQ